MFVVTPIINAHRFEATIKDMSALCISNPAATQGGIWKHFNEDDSYIKIVQSLSGTFHRHDYRIIKKFAYNNWLFIQLRTACIPIAVQQSNYLINLFKIAPHNTNYYMVIFKDKEKYLLAKALNII